MLIRLVGMLFFSCIFATQVAIAAPPQYIFTHVEATPVILRVVSLDASKVYTFYTTDNTPSTADPLMYLLDPSGNVVTYDDDSGSGVNAQISNYHPPVSSAEYRILVRAYACFADRRTKHLLGESSRL